MADTFKGIVTADGKKRQLPYRNILDIPISDPSLTVDGGFADAAAVGKKIKKTDDDVASLKEDKVNKPSAADDGKIPRAKGGEVEWVEVGQPTDDQTDNAVTKWLDQHPEATTTVQNGAITEETINGNFLPWIKKDYITPEMFGAVGDGVQDDTNAIQSALSNGTTIIFSNKKYKCTDKLDVSDKIIYGFDATIDFADYKGGDCVISNGNHTKINGINICNTASASGYALKLIYIANYGSIENVQIRNCKNGIYISGSWYNNLSNILIQSSDSESGVCMVFGDEKYANAANGMVFNNIFLHGGAYGILFKNVTVNSIEFSGITVEQQSKCGIIAENSNGNITLSDVYFENCAPTSEYPLLDVGILMVNIFNALIRGQYTNCINAYKGSRITKYGYTYNPANISNNVGFGVLKPIELENTSYPAIILSQGSKIEGFNIIKQSNASALSFKIILKQDNDFAVKIKSFGNLPEDTSASYYDEITIYAKMRSNYPNMYVKAEHLGARDLSQTYAVTYSKNIATSQIEYTLNLENTNGYYSKYNVTNYVSVISKSSRIIKIEEIN